MYASDYGFAASPSAWATRLDKYDGTSIKSTNWMFLGAIEWTISRNAYDGSRVFYVIYTGYVYYDKAIYAYAVRPVFSLTSSVNYASGSGSATDPIVVN